MARDRARVRVRPPQIAPPYLPCTAAPRLSRRRDRQSNERHEARATPWPMTTNRSERDVATASAARGSATARSIPAASHDKAPPTDDRRNERRRATSDERAPARVERTPARVEQSTSGNGQKRKAPPQQAQRERERPSPTNSHARCVTGRGCHSPIQHNRTLRSSRRRPRRQTLPSSQ